jgi:ketosteroid isomerase-like protein
MKALIKTALVLVGCLSMDPALAQPAKAPSQDPTVSDTIKQLEQDWTDAMIHVDLDKVSQVMADDWADGSGGKITTKADFIAAVKSGKHKLEACEFGPRDVKVFGDVAVLQGSVTEKSIADGKLRTIRVSYMDVWVKRGDRWMVVRSHAKKL